MTYRDLAERDSPMTWSFRPASMSYAIMLWVVSFVAILGALVLMSDTVRVRCQREPSGVLRMCRVTSGPLFFRASQDLPLDAESNVSVLRRVSTGKRRSTYYVLTAGPPDQHHDISGSLPTSGGLEEVARRVNAFLRGHEVGELDENAGWSGTGVLPLLGGLAAAVAAFTALRRRIRIVIDQERDEILVYVGMTASPTTPQLFRPDPRARFGIEEGEKGTMHLFFEGGPGKGRLRLCSTSARLERTLVEVNAALAALPPRPPEVSDAAPP